MNFYKHQPTGSSLGSWSSSWSFGENCHPFFVLFYYFFIEVQLIYKVVLISAVQHSDSVIHAYVYILFHYGSL